MTINLKSLNLRNYFKDDSSENINIENEESFLEACNLLRTQREQCNLSREDLSRKTKISIVVIEAIEKGWANQFPEKTFLKQMLLTIELNLYLPRNSLISILNKSNQNNETKVLKPIKIFTPLNIDIYRTWHGNLIYFLLMFVSIYAINNQQNYISGKNSLMEQPIRLEINSIEAIKESSIINKEVILY